MVLTPSPTEPARIITNNCVQFGVSDLWTYCKEVAASFHVRRDGVDSFHQIVRLVFTARAELCVISYLRDLRGRSEAHS